MSELTTNARSLLDAAKRATPGPSAEAIERMERHVLLAVGVSATATATGAAVVKGAGLWSAAVAKIVLGTTLLLVGGVVGAAIVWRPQTTPPPVAVLQAPQVIVAEAPAPAPIVEPSPPPLPEPAPAPILKPRAIRLTPPPPPPPAPLVEQPAPKPVPSVLPTARELSVLRSALDHIDALEWNEGLAFLDRHDVEFPDGALRDEAAVLRVLALCGLEQVSAAFDVAAQVRARAPKSPALARLSTSCVSP